MVPEQAARRALANDWFERAVRGGHAAKAAVFGGVGYMAARLALGDQDETPDFPGAMESLSEQPLDVLLLSVLALGLFAYAGWRFAHGLADLDDAGNGLKGWVRRGAMFAVGLTYAGFGVYAIALLLGLRRDDAGVVSETATVLQWPMGRWIVGAVGAGVAAAGLMELFIAFTGRYRDEFCNARLRWWERWIAFGAGCWGHAARGAIYCAAGFYAIKSAIIFDPSEARGFADTLWVIGNGPWGRWLLLFIAAGLMAFGVYSLMLAIHRHIPDQDEQPEPQLP
jgi:hypothetical protein